MRLPKIASSFVAGLMLVIAAPAHQPCSKSQHGKLTGRLIDLRCDVGVHKAVVTIKGGKVKRKVKSNRDGTFEACLTVGTYQLDIEKYGFKHTVVIDVKVTSDSAANINVRMEEGYASDDPNAYEESLKPCPPPNKSINRTRS